MASIYKRKSKDRKSVVWSAVIRIKGYPTVYDTFERKQVADDWAQDTERRIKRGQHNFETNNTTYTYSHLLNRMITDGVLQHHRSLKNTQAQYDYVKQLRWLPENPCKNLLKLKEAPGRDRILNDAEITRLLDACRQIKSPYLYPIVLFALTTGARHGEVLGLEWRHVDFDSHLAHLKKTKNDRPRSVALVEPLIIELKALWAARHPQKTLVIASKTAFGCVDIKKAWMEALKRAGILDYHFHDLRHQFCTFAAGQGASNVELATAMGHRTLSMLLRYSNLDAKNSKKFSDHISEKILKGNTHE